MRIYVFLLVTSGSDLSDYLPFSGLKTEFLTSSGHFQLCESRANKGSPFFVQGMSTGHCLDGKSPSTLLALCKRFLEYHEILTQKIMKSGHLHHERCGCSASQMRPGTYLNLSGDDLKGKQRKRRCLFLFSNTVSTDAQ
jgi:hypothetical protein